MAETSNGRVTVRELYDELQPMRDDLSTLKAKVEWLVRLSFLILAALIADGIARLGGTSGPQTAKTAVESATRLFL